MLSLMSVLNKSSHFTASYSIQIPPTVPLSHYSNADRRFVLSPISLLRLLSNPFALSHALLFNPLSLSRRLL